MSSERCKTIVFDNELQALICLETGEVLEDKIIDYSPPNGKGGEEVSNEPIIPVSEIVHDYNIGTDRKWMTYHEVRLATVFIKARLFIKALGLPQYLLKDVTHIMRKTYGKGGSMGRKTDEMIGAVILAVARSNGIIIPIHRFSQELGLNKRKLWRYYLWVVKETGLKQYPVTLEGYVESSLAFLEAKNEKCVLTAYSIINRLPPKIRAENPLALAGSIAYLTFFLCRDETSPT